MCRRRVKRTGLRAQSFTKALYLVVMKLHLAAIAFNEKELETYVSQLKSQSFETVSEVKKAEDGSWYQVLARTVRQEAVVSQVKASTMADVVAEPQA